MKILIAEDEKGIASFLKQGLEEEGFEIFLASNGQIATDMALKNKPDLILLDWSMPIMTGIDACRAIRQRDKQTPILFVTAKDTLQETIAGLKAGANDYIKKPFSFEELLERIRVHFRNSEEANELKIGKTVILLSRYQVFQDGAEVSLTQREFDLLSYLIRNKGRVCTRQQIIQDVWNIHFEYDTGVIDVFINALRKKLNLRGADDYIKTIRGVGYLADDLKQ